MPGHAEQVPRARAFIARALAARGLCDELACLLGSELVTNAVRHSDSRLPGGTVTLTVTETRGEILVAVTDDRYHRGEGRLTTWFQLPAEPA